MNDKYETHEHDVLIIGAGGAGLRAAIEALACLIAMERGAVPPTINLEDADPECGLCHVANEARSQTVRVAVSNSFGFGGSNLPSAFGPPLRFSARARMVLNGTVMR